MPAHPLLKGWLRHWKGEEEKGGKEERRREKKKRNEVRKEWRGGGEGVT